MASRGGRWAEEGWVGRRGEVGGGGGWAEDGLRGALAAGWAHLLLLLHPLVVRDEGQRGAVVEEDLLARPDEPVRAQRGDTRQQPHRFGLGERHEAQRRVGVVARLVVGHGAGALRPLRRVRVPRPAEVAAAGQRLLLDAEREVPAVDQEVRVADAHEVAAALRVAYVLAYPGLLRGDELAAVDADELVLLEVDAREEAAPHHVVALQPLHARRARLHLFVGERRQVAPQLLVSLGWDAAQHQ